MLLAHELAWFLDFDVDQHKIPTPGRARPDDVDIVLAKQRVLVEYDGSYWHRDKQEADRAKSARLEAAGWTVIRVREAPLEACGSHDVVVATGDVKAAAAGVLDVLADLGCVRRAEVDRYQERPGLVNEAAGRAAIAELLTRRAQRRRP